MGLWGILALDNYGEIEYNTNMSAEFQKIYIVRGDTGEYSGATQWDFRAFTDRERAYAQEEKLNKLLKANNLSMSDYKWEGDHKEGEEIMTDFDPEFRNYGTGVTYYVSEVDLDDF